jgi:hypothetical protein
MILVRSDSDLHRPEQLRRKRVGVLEYQQTAVLWIRSILQREFGVAPTEMRWVMERPPARSHGGKTGFVPPPGFDDIATEEHRFRTATGIYPMNHCVVIRRTLAEQHSTLTRSVYDACVAARDLVSDCIHPMNWATRHLSEDVKRRHRASRPGGHHPASKTVPAGGYRK